MRHTRHRDEQPGPFEEGAAIIVAYGLDLLGEPPPAFHPVVWYGKLIHCLEQAAPDGRMRQVCYGAAMLLLAAPMALLPAVGVCHLARTIRLRCRQRGKPLYGLLLYALIKGLCLKPFFALRMLIDAGRLVRQPLERADLPAARHALRNLVSRDRSHLSAEQAGAAAIESLAENLSDSVIAPLFYYALFDLPGAALYRLFNTFDSMIGYHGHYEYLGKAAARLDDALNLVPSRITALLIIALAPLFDGERHEAWKIWLRDAGKTASPNAGQPMAAAAGALGLQLEKAHHYALGDAKQVITPRSILQAERMAWVVGSAAILPVLACLTLRRLALWNK